MTYKCSVSCTVGRQACEHLCRRRLGFCEMQVGEGFKVGQDDWQILKH